MQKLIFAILLSFSPLALGWGNPCIEEVKLPVEIAYKALSISEQDQRKIFSLSAMETKLKSEKCLREISNDKFIPYRRVTLILKPYTDVIDFCKFKSVELQGLNNDWKDPEHTREYYLVGVGGNCHNISESDLITLESEIPDKMVKKLLTSSSSIIKNVSIKEKIETKGFKVFAIGVSTLDNGRTFYYFTVGRDGADSWYQVYVNEQSDGEFSIESTAVWMS